ncbi:MAG: ISLre2 family transposase [Gottschalkiaceae bacterium]|nr:MAG: ISLre2 family transposase [Gottschalkiaceae bacterium]
MNTIIHEIVEKITLDMKNNLEDLILDSKDISHFIINTGKSLDEIGVKIVKEALEMLDETIRESSTRKKEYYIQRRNDKKTLITKFGEVNYQRTYYKNKKDGSYDYLSDRMVGIESYERMDLSYEAELIKEAMDNSYHKSGKKVSPNTQVTKQTVLNSIRKLGNVENKDAELKTKKKEVKIIYIEADEDHVAMQDGKNKEIKLIYVHEGKKFKSKDRYELINKRYFTGSLKNTEDLWLEVADYLEEAYNLDKVEKIYLSGDGARWIKEGLNWIKGSQYVLDYFHLSKYVRKATAHQPHTFSNLWNYINQHNKEATRDLLNIIIEETKSETKKESVKDCKRYILNNWEGIIRRYEKEYVGCSAESHISHILSSRLSSRPLGWSKIGADQMARLRVYNANGGDLYELMSKKKKDQAREERIIELEKRLVKKKLRSSIPESLDNIPYISDGRRSWQRQILRTMRGA